MLECHVQTKQHQMSEMTPQEHGIITILHCIYLLTEMVVGGQMDASATSAGHHPSLLDFVLS